MHGSPVTHPNPSLSRRVVAALCDTAAVGLCVYCAAGGWAVAHAYGADGGAVQLFLLISLIISLAVSTLVLLGVRSTGIRVRPLAIFAWSAAVLLAVTSVAIWIGLSQRDETIRAACREPVATEVMTLARSAGVGSLAGAGPLGRVDGSCGVHVQIRGDAAIALDALAGHARRLGWSALNAHAWRSPSGVVATAWVTSQPPWIVSPLEVVSGVDLSARRP
jgi:hypothetical protein